MLRVFSMHWASMARPVRLCGPLRAVFLPVGKYLYARAIFGPSEPLIIGPQGQGFKGSPLLYEKGCPFSMLANTMQAAA